MSGAGEEADRLLTRGHETARRAVLRWVVTESPPHAVLLAGPPNVGKTTLAEDLAAGLLCLAEDPSDRPCRACVACRKVARLIHPDVHHVEAPGPGGQIRIAAARALTTELALLPAEGRRRIAIIAGAQHLNEDAQNALLKTLEEPPPGVTIVLCADDEDPLLTTVRSRCVRVNMPALAPRTLAALLAEHGVDDPARAARIARLASGRPGVALAIARRPDLELALGRVARRFIDLVAADRRARLAATNDLMADGGLLADLEAGGALESTGRASEPASGRDDTDPAVESRAVAAPAQRRRAVGGLLRTWRSVARDLAVAGRGARAGIRWIDLLDELERTARSLEPGDIERFLERIERVGAMIEANANPELALDVLLLAWPQAHRADPQTARAREAAAS
jgi:DNA polymerase-3 subunit delta'